MRKSRRTGRRLEPGVLLLMGASGASLSVNALLDELDTLAGWVADNVDGAADSRRP